MLESAEPAPADRGLQGGYRRRGRRPTGLQTDGQPTPAQDPRDGRPVGITPQESIARDTHRGGGVHAISGVGPVAVPAGD